MANLKELNKLEKYLKEKGIKYTRKDEERIDTKYNWHQIKVYNDHQEVVWDVICHYGSYGYEQGLLETQGLYFGQEESVKGWLTADEIIKKLE